MVLGKPTVMNGIIEIFYSFLKYLEEKKEAIAVLQLTGKIEDFLVKEFVYFVYKSSGGKNFALVNIGNKNQQKIDLCLIRGKNVNTAEIYGLIEAKYFRNRHRLWSSNAMDEIVPTLKDLSRQLHIFADSSHGVFNVNLKSKTNVIYGLVFASYVDEDKNEFRKKHFYKTILDKASKNFKYHDLSKPYFRPVYDDVEIKVLNSVFYATLKVGLWKSK